MVNSFGSFGFRCNVSMGLSVDIKRQYSRNCAVYGSLSMSRMYNCTNSGDSKLLTIGGLPGEVVCSANKSRTQAMNRF
jgi:hypothetical protein